MRWREIRGCGNATPVEITERFPQGFGNLAHHARFPHFHKPVLFLLMTGHVTYYKNRTFSFATNRLALALR